MAAKRAPNAAIGHTVVGDFDGPNHAGMALDQLRDGGFTPSRVPVVARDTR